MDVMGEVFLADGTKLSVVTGIDDHSRFCVCAKLVTRATARPVCDALLDTLNAHGIPDQILTDNGKVLTGKLARKPAFGGLHTPWRGDGSREQRLAASA